MNKVVTVADSLLNLPWLFVQSNHENHTLKGEDLPQNNPVEQEKHLMYFNKRDKELEKESNGFETIEYFLDVEINHPVSDKSMYRMTFSSSFKATKLNNFQASQIDFTDLLKVGELHKNFINQKEIMIPDHAFVLHLKLTIPSMNKRKLYSSLVCSTKDFLEKDFSKSSTQEYSVGLEIDKASFITLKLRTFKVDFSTETGAAAIARMFPTDSQSVLKVLPMFRFVLYETVCECQFESSEVKRIDPRRPQHGHKQSAEYLGQPDYYTIYNTQNNYFFQPQQPMNNQTYFQDPMRWESTPFAPSDGYGPTYSHNSRSGLYEQMFAKGNRFPERTDSHDYWGKYQQYERGWNDHSTQQYPRPNQQPDFDRADANKYNFSMQDNSGRSSNATIKAGQSWIQDPQASPASSSGPSLLKLHTSSNSDPGNLTNSEEGSAGMSPAGEETCTLEQILQFPKLFKQHANSKSKNPLIQRLVKAMNQEETLSMLETLKPLAKEICKNKYGNYIVQVIAKSIDPIFLEKFLEAVVYCPDRSCNRTSWRSSATPKAPLPSRASSRLFRQPLLRR